MSLMMNLSCIWRINLSISICPEMTDINLYLRLTIFIHMPVKTWGTGHMKCTRTWWHPSTHQACIIRMSKTCLLSYISMLNIMKVVLIHLRTWALIQYRITSDDILWRLICRWRRINSKIYTTFSFISLASLIRLIVRSGCFLSGWVLWIF